MRAASYLWGGVFVLGVFITVPASASAQPSCGRAYIDQLTHQPSGFLAVRVIARTTRDIVACPLQVQVEAWVEGVGGAVKNTGNFAAEVNFVRPVPRPGVWTSVSKHWLIWTLGLQWDFLGTLVTETTVERPADITGAEQCALDGGTWVDTGRRGTCTYQTTPLIVDVRGNGYTLTDADDGVWFDIDADGAPDKVAWTSVDSDDAFLAVDRNGNGQIDDGSELFGEHTPAYADVRDPEAANGFEALKFTEGPTYGSSKTDEIIDRSDAIFDRLVLWRDLNHNGVSDPGELESAAGSGLEDIGTDAKSSRRRDKHGNEFRLRAKSQWREPSGKLFERPVSDVWLVVQ